MFADPYNPFVSLMQSYCCSYVMHRLCVSTENAVFDDKLHCKL